MIHYWFKCTFRRMWKVLFCVLLWHEIWHGHDLPLCSNGEIMISWESIPVQVKKNPQRMKGMLVSKAFLYSIILLTVSKEWKLSALFNSSLALHFWPVSELNEILLAACILPREWEISCSRVMLCDNHLA